VSRLAGLATPPIGDQGPGKAGPPSIFQVPGCQSSYADGLRRFFPVASVIESCMTPEKKHIKLPVGWDFPLIPSPIHAVPLYAGVISSH
jgi:hypothetical protein